MSKSFAVIDDAPVEKEVVVEKQGSWVKNLVTGIVATGGLGLGAVMLIGAAVGAGAVTTVVAVNDYKSGQARSYGEFLHGLVTGMARGAMAGAMIYGLWTALPTVANYSIFTAQYYTGIVSPLTYNILPKAVIFGGYGLLGAQGVRQMNEIAGIGSGQNWTRCFY